MGRAWLARSKVLFLCLIALVLGCSTPPPATGPTSFHLGGSVTGLNGKLVLTNGADAVLVTSDGSFLFDSLVADRAAFDVEVGVEPENQRCTIDDGAGTFAGKDITNVTVTCMHGSDGVPVSIGGFVSGLGAGAVTLLLDNTEAVSVSANGAFTFPDGLPMGATYFVTVASQPSDSICSIQGAAGTVSMPSVSTILVSCASTNAGLSALVVSDGQLAPPFDPTVSSYQDLLGIGASSLKLTITPANGASTILVNGFPTAAGVPTLPIPLELGMNLITIDVTAVAGNTRTYAIVATRATDFTYAKATSPSPGDAFGTSVAVQGTTLAVGAPNALGGGAVYVYQRSGTMWSPQAVLQAANGSTGYAFGSSVALDADTIVVGSPGEASNATGINGVPSTTVTMPGSGAAYVFQRTGTMWTQTTYIKASNTDASDNFGAAVALLGDELDIGAPGEASSATGINGTQADNSSPASGAVYAFTRAGTSWSQQAFIKASTNGAGNKFGSSLSISGSLIAVGAPGESSSATGINGNQSNKSAPGSGAAYVFGFPNNVFAQQAYVKPSNTSAGEAFGTSVSISGLTLAVGAPNEPSAGTGINANQADISAAGAGAVYVYLANGTNWAQQAYIKSSNTHAGDHFGGAVAIEDNALVVGAPNEASASTGINGNQADISAPGAGAAYSFTRINLTWSQQAYIKAPNTDAGDLFGSSVGIGKGTLGIGATGEASAAMGVNGDESDNSMPGAGAAYVTP